MAGEVPAGLLNSLGNKITEDELRSYKRMLGDPEIFDEVIRDLGIDPSEPLEMTAEQKAELDRLLDEAMAGDNGAQQGSTCTGCLSNQPNQLAHKEPGGCLRVPDFSPEEIDAAVAEIMGDGDGDGDGSAGAGAGAGAGASQTAEQVMSYLGHVAEREAAPDGLNSLGSIKFGRERKAPDKLDI